MQKWGLIRSDQLADDESHFTFPDLAVIRQAEEALAEGLSFRAVLRKLVASRAGQLAFDFRIEAQPAKVLQLKRREPPPLAAFMDPVPEGDGVVVGGAVPRRVAPRQRRSGQL